MDNVIVTSKGRVVIPVKYRRWNMVPIEVIG